MFYPRTMSVSVQLNNTGRVRLEPTVAVNGAPATGPGVLVSKAKESYDVTTKIGFFGTALVIGLLLFAVFAAFVRANKARESSRRQRYELNASRVANADETARVGRIVVDEMAVRIEDVHAVLPAPARAIARWQLAF